MLYVVHERRYTLNSDGQTAPRVMSSYPLSYIEAAGIARVWRQSNAVVRVGHADIWLSPVEELE